MSHFLERCETYCNSQNIYLTEQEREIIEEYSIEGLTPAQAPQLIKNLRYKADAMDTDISDHPFSGRGTSAGEY